MSTHRPLLEGDKSTSATHFLSSMEAYKALNGKMSHKNSGLLLKRLLAVSHILYQKGCKS